MNHKVIYKTIKKGKNKDKKIKKEGWVKINKLEKYHLQNSHAELAKTCLAGVGYSHIDVLY